jgi:DNA (cytosine-5)-methyltransferase 1
MKIVSLFSGAGGLDLGLQWSGHEIVWANDIFAEAVATYRKNVSPHISDTDITKVPSSVIPDCDVVVGGFPCQGFSVANWGRTESDPRNQLFHEMVRVVRDKQPRYFVGENVKGLVSMAEGRALQVILQEFARAGYIVHHAVVNAADYGVPQARKRLLIVGVRKDLPPLRAFPPRPTHASPEIAEFMGLQPWVSVGKALAHLPDPELGQHIANHTASKYKLRFNGHLGHRTIDPDKPSPTVTARGDDRGGVVVLHHPGNHRRMTARELAVVQSFPDEFEFCGTRTNAYRQIANAVPPLLGRAIGQMLMEQHSSGVELMLQGRE